MVQYLNFGIASLLANHLLWLQSFGLTRFAYSVALLSAQDEDLPVAGYKPLEARNVQQDWPDTFSFFVKDPQGAEYISLFVRDSHCGLYHSANSLSAMIFWFLCCWMLPLINFILHYSFDWRVDGRDRIETLRSRSNRVRGLHQMHSNKYHDSPALQTLSTLNSNNHRGYRQRFPYFQIRFDCRLQCRMLLMIRARRKVNNNDGDCTSMLRRVYLLRYRYDFISLYLLEVEDTVRS